MSEAIRKARRKSIVAQIATESVILYGKRAVSWVENAGDEPRRIGERSHGASLGVPITEDGERAMRMLEAECASPTGCENLSAVSLGHWPVLAMACRHAGLPLPPDLWLGLLQRRGRRTLVTARIDSNRECGLR